MRRPERPQGSGRTPRSPGERPGDSAPSATPASGSGAGTPAPGQKWQQALEARLQAARYGANEPVQARQIEGVLQALNLTVTADTVSRLLSYLELFSKWNRTYNLTAIRDPQAMLTQHLADCLAAVGPLCRHLRQRHAGWEPVRQPAVPAGAAAGAATDRPSLLDVGSGGGLPGVVFAILAPELQVSCVDAVGKKAAFIQQAGLDLGLENLRALHARVESLSGVYDVISSRAFAALADSCAWTRHLLRPADAPGGPGVWLAMKGQRPDDEIAALPGEVQVQAIEPVSVPGLDAERCLVWLARQP